MCCGSDPVLASSSEVDRHILWSSLAPFRKVTSMPSGVGSHSRHAHRCRIGNRTSGEGSGRDITFEPGCIYPYCCLDSAFNHSEIDQLVSMFWAHMYASRVCQLLHHHEYLSGPVTMVAALLQKSWAGLSRKGSVVWAGGAALF